MDYIQASQIIANYINWYGWQKVQVHAPEMKLPDHRPFCFNGMEVRSVPRQYLRGIVLTLLDLAKEGANPFDSTIILQSFNYGLAKIEILGMQSFYHNRLP